jgi:DNA-binding XRE family transcriptional regulator
VCCGVSAITAKTSRTKPSGTRAWNKSLRAVSAAIGPAALAARGRGLSQEQLARRANVTISTLRAIEAGTVVNPGYFIVMALLAVLDARPEDLATYAGPDPVADE